MNPNQPGSGQPDFSSTAGLNPPNFSQNQFGGNPVGQAAASAPHNTGSPFDSSQGLAASMGSPQFSGQGGGTLGGAGEGIKALTKSNKELTAAIKELTRSLGGGQRIGPDGGPGGGGGRGGGLGGFPGGNGGGMGGSAFDRQLLYGARGAQQRMGRNFPGGAGQAPASPIHRADQFAGSMISGASGPDDVSARFGLPGGVPEGSMQGFQIGFRGGFRGGAMGEFGPSARRFGFARGFTRGLVMGPAHMSDRHFDQQLRMEGFAQDFINTSINRDGLHPIQVGQDLGEVIGQEAQYTGNYYRGAQSAQSARQYMGAVARHQGKNFLRGTRDYGFRMGASGNLIELAASSPFIGGAVAAPLQTLQNRGVQSAALELPSAILSAHGRHARLPFGQATGQGAITTHGAFLNAMATSFGLDASQSLNMANQIMSASGGGISGNAEILGSIFAAYGGGHEISSYTTNFAMRQAGSNLNRTGFGSSQFANAVGMADSMGLKGQSGLNFVNAVAGMGAQFRGMGIDLGEGTMRSVSRLAASGFSSLEGQGALEGYTRIRQKTGIAASQNLGGLFAGIGNDILMAQAIQQTGGNLDRASALLEGLSPEAAEAMLARGTGVKNGSPLFEMLQMGQGLTVAERRAVGRGRNLPGMTEIANPFGVGHIVNRSGTKLTQDIDLSATLALDTNQMLQEFQTGKTSAGVEFTEAFKQMAEQNKRIERKLLEGINVKDFDKIVKLAGQINSKISSVPRFIDKVISFFGG